MKLCGVYLIRNVVTGLVLVGSSKHIRQRWTNHKWTANHGQHRNPKFQRAWRKYGAKSFIFSIIELCAPSRRIARETFWVRSYASLSHDRGYNLLLPNRREVSSETRRRMSLAKKGKKNSNFGRVWSRGIRRKMSLAHLGLGHTAKTRKEMSRNRRGRNNPNYGKEMPDWLREKLRRVNRGKKLPYWIKRKISPSLARSWAGKIMPGWKWKKLFTASLKGKHAK